MPEQRPGTRDDDILHMRAALSLARRGLGQTAPNPSVGCVLVQGGRVVGRGRTAAGGRPHAEVEALAMAGSAARGATAYVTLEPCAFTGKTGPCTAALIEAGIARLVVGTADPHPKVNGAGIRQIRDAGIEVLENVLHDECVDVISGFLTVITHGRPLFLLKTASTLDGKIATGTKQSQWLTGEASRRAAHGLRGRFDAVMAGVGTVLADDPELICRIEGMRAAPLVRIIVDSHLRTPLMSRLVRGAAVHPLWLLHRDGADPHRRRALENAGVKLFELPASSAGINLTAAARTLAKAGLTQVMVEGGGTLAAGLLRANLVDRLAWFHAPGLIGNDGWPAIQNLALGSLADMPRFSLRESHIYGDDTLTIFGKG
jgi:diaminohydroxyphosphoribosylaminopyrimidine deaminase/5-amino-6-(5-phosphoribosylamino)uracil reductase